MDVALTPTEDPDGYFGEEVAARYDSPGGREFQPEVIAETVDVLAELADGGRALEFASGTGRIALPLGGRGVPVDGIEMSRAMTARLRAKPGGDAVRVTHGDMATTRVDGRYRLVYLVFNTLMNLTTQDAQVECFRNAAAHLEPGGCFVVEVMVPDLRRLPQGQTAVPFQVGTEQLAFDLYDVTTQAMSSNYVRFGREGGARGGDLWSVPFRYVWPSELDLMARIAGLRLRDRWDDWDRAPFHTESAKHVSVWEKPAG